MQRAGPVVLRLVPRPGVLRGRARAPVGDPRARFQIEVPLEPVSFGGRTEETSLVLDFMVLPITEWSELPGLDRSFPRNPEPGYVDGSIYLADVHNPADLTRIRFGDLRDDVVRATLDFVVNFEHEGPLELGRPAFSWDVALALEPRRLPAFRPSGRDP